MTKSLDYKKDGAPSLETISDSFSEEDVLKGHLLRITIQHQQTGCDGMLSVFVGDEEIAPVIEVIDAPDRIAHVHAMSETLKNDHFHYTNPKTSRTTQEDLILVQGLDSSVSYTTQSLNLRVGCDCCELSWERATKGIFKSQQTKNSGKEITYFVEQDNHYASTNNFLNTYNSSPGKIDYSFRDY